MTHSRRTVTCFIYLIVAMTVTQSSLAIDNTRPDYGAERAARAKSLTQPFGWFSLTALQWLKPGVTTVGSAADNSVVLANAPAHLATFESKGGQVVVTAHDPSLAFHSAPLETSPHHTVIGTGEDDNSALTSGTLRLWVIDRGGRRYLRIKDSQAPALKHFHGLRWYPADQHYRRLAGFPTRRLTSCR